MSRHERSTYFERLVTLKLRPAGDDDRLSVISVEDMILVAEAALLAAELDAATTELEDADAIEAAELATSLAALEPAPDAAPLTKAVDYTELPATPDGRNPNRHRPD